MMILISKNINRNSEHKRGNDHQYLELTETDYEFMSAMQELFPV